MKKRISLGVLVIILAIGLSVAVVWYQLNFRQRAVVQPVAIIKVFQNEGQTDELKQGETLDWGDVTTGTYKMDLWVNNTGTVSAVLLFDYRRDQMPGDWQLEWDYDGTALAHYELRKVTLTLTLPENIGAGEYGWDSWIHASQAP